MSDQSPRNPGVHMGNPLADAATGAGKPVDVWPPLQEEIAAASLHRAAAPMERMPASLASSIASKLDMAMDEQTLAERDATTAPLPFAATVAKKFSLVPWAIAAAALLAGAVTIGVISGRLSARQSELVAAKEQVKILEARISDNTTVLAKASAHIESLARDLTTRTDDLRDKEAQVIAAAQRNTLLAQQLADATTTAAQRARELDDAKLVIARLEAPADPQIALQNRTKLLEVPDTIRVAWAPFNLDGAPAAEQPNITGDVVWNDRLETGYLRFVGLKPNDPTKEQYQVWVIDERGMEQKVSGGIFNATADGEVIVPITPGIAVGRVALFAITVEKPGGTWVPDLKRRVVVAPRAQ
jgi:uncharacterized membrane-anchored protein YhcB (DUF1043 family)